MHPYLVEGALQRSAVPTKKLVSCEVIRCKVTEQKPKSTYVRLRPSLKRLEHFQS